MDTGAANNNSIFSEEYRIINEIDTTANDISCTERWSANLIIFFFWWGVTIIETDSTRIAVITNKVSKTWKDKKPITLCSQFIVIVT